MTKRISFRSALVLIFFFFSLVCGTAASLYGAEKPVSAGDGYVVCLEENRICVVPAGGSEPIFETSADPASLPEEDLHALRRGIPVSTAQEALMLLEDFGS